MPTLDEQLKRNAYLRQLLPVLKVIGVDPEAILKKMTKARVSTRLDKALPLVADRLKRDGLTPAVKGDSPEAERQVIRSAMYLLAKASLPFKKGANVAADFLRDSADDKIVALVSPRVDASTSVEDLLALVKTAWLELMF